MPPVKQMLWIAAIALVVIVVVFRVSTIRKIATGS
jgi:hypothetical protein